jgi:hypothetical protein
VKKNEFMLEKARGILAAEIKKAPQSHARGRRFDLAITKVDG